ncbi:MAG: hypothetical protein GY841_12305 [FCB group bacterium]|nr:hypothetical protein [FCB group bacterium]
MNRYSIQQGAIIRSYPHLSYEGKLLHRDDHGEWVKYEDAVARIKKANEDGYRTGFNNQRIPKDNDQLVYEKGYRHGSYDERQNQREKLGGLECNCAEMAGPDIKGYSWGGDDRWICPAHGYKRR